MIPERRQRPPEESVDSWLMSYADMITLLLCFFIIFVSVSEPKRDRLSAITEGMASQFGTVDLSTPFDGAFRSLKSVIEVHKLYNDAAVEKTEASIEMEISTLTFFKPDSAELDEAKMPILNDLASAIKSIGFIDYRITVEGHSSNKPFSTPIYPTNWELTSARAARIVRFFIDQGIKPDVLRAVGYADTKPKVPNLDLNGNPIVENQGKNQRIIIKVERII